MNGPILVVGPAWVGDMVMAQSLCGILAAREPGVPIDVLAPTWTEPLARRMPQVRETIPLPLAHGQLHLSSRRRIGQTLRSRGYAQAVVLPSSLKSALVPFWARIPRRTGYRGEFRWGLLNDVRPFAAVRLRTTAERFAALGLAPGRCVPDPFPLPLPRLQVEPDARAAVVARLGLRLPQRPVLALCPGAEYGSAKRWPAEHFAAVGRHQLARGWAVWLFGSARDAVTTRRIGRLLAGECLDLAGRTSLVEALDLLSLAQVVVSNDSGLMHVAAALDRNLVALFGASDPALNPPLCPRARVLWLGLECSPCLARVCPHGHRHCLRKLLPERVTAAIEEFEP